MASTKTIQTRCSNGVTFGHREVVAKDHRLLTREDLNTLAGGGSNGIGKWLITGKAAVNSIFGDLVVGDVFTSAAGTEIPVSGDKAKYMTLATEDVGDGVKTFTVHGGGAGLYLITAKASSNSFFGTAVVGSVVTVLASDVMVTGDKAQKVTLGSEVLGEDYETDLYTAYLFDFGVSFDLAFSVLVTAADGTKKNSVVLTYPGVGQVLVTYTTVVAGDIISVIAQRALEEKSSSIS